MIERFDANSLMEQLANKFRKTPGTTIEDRKRAEGGKVDGRTLRKTGRTELFSARVRPETKAALQAYASDKGLLLGEVLEHALAALLTKKS